ncbi:MAG: hypothetical protein LUF02_02135 [Erysipelotrichaceae bacterium]|nr:hypothetical protein [Erysipelotrichaceae bacterium]
MKIFKIIRRIIVLIIVLSLIVLCGFGFFVSPNEYTFKNIRFRYVNENVGSDLNDFKIAFISDVNLNDDDSLERFSNIVDDLNEQDFDMVIFGGDLYEDSIFSDEEVAEVLKSINCKYGKLAILGDKDKNNTLEITIILNNGGFEVLSDTSRTIYYENATFTLLVYDDETDISLLDASSSTITIGIAHYPDTYTTAKDYVNLQLSGHSLGGSIYLPYFGALFSEEGCTTYNHGTYQTSNSALVVSNGVTGTSSFPFKLFAQNQILIVSLNTASSD